MFYIVESSKSFYEACLDLTPIVQRLGFVVLASHDIGDMLLARDIDLDDDCRVFEICNYRLVEKLLTIDMRHSLGLPWRISVFTENGTTRIGVERPDPLAATAADPAELARQLAEIDDKLTMIVDEAR